MFSGFGLPAFLSFDFSNFDYTSFTYGNYVGENYSAGAVGGEITGTSADPAPVDAVDALAYWHDLGHQQATNSEERLAADIELVQGISALVSHEVSHWMFW